MFLVRRSSDKILRGGGRGANGKERWQESYGERGRTERSEGQGSKGCYLCCGAWGCTVPVTVSETWGSNSAVEAGGVGWRRGVVGASGEHMDEGTQNNNNNNRNE